MKPTKKELKQALELKRVRRNNRARYRRERARLHTAVQEAIARGKKLRKRDRFRTTRLDESLIKVMGHKTMTPVQITIALLKSGCLDANVPVNAEAYIAYIASLMATYIMQDKREKHPRFERVVRGQYRVCDPEMQCATTADEVLAALGFKPEDLVHPKPKRIRKNSEAESILADLGF